MQFSKVQLSAIINNSLKGENRLNEVMEMMLNAMMKSERSAHLERIFEIIRLRFDPESGRVTFQDMIR